MSDRLFMLKAKYEGQPDPQAIYSTNENVLRMFGKDHHAAAKIKPDLFLIDPDGATLATMDEWATDWCDLAGHSQGVR